MPVGIAPDQFVGDGPESNRAAPGPYFTKTVDRIIAKNIIIG